MNHGPSPALYKKSWASPALYTMNIKSCHKIMTIDHIKGHIISRTYHIKGHITLDRAPYYITVPIKFPPYLRSTINKEKWSKA